MDLLTQDQKKARYESWNDNIARVVFGIPLPGQKSKNIIFINDHCSILSIVDD